MALETFGNFKCGNTWNVGKEGATQLIAITKLLCGASFLRGANRLATNNDLQKVTADIKEAIASTSNSAHPPTTTSYAAAAKRGLGGTPLQAAPPRQKVLAELQEKQIFISTKNVSRDAPFLKWEPAIVTRYCNDIIANFFEKNPGLVPPAAQAVRGISKSATENITLTFKTTEDADKARAHASKWVKHVNPRATSPERSFAVVAHNAPNNFWSDSDDLAAAIDNIELDNPHDTQEGCQIANLAWLSGAEVREKTKRGPLMLSFRSKAAANEAIENGLVIEGIICSVSLYIPRPPQCFRCQDWGHRATGCPGEARCGRCAGPHATADHTCTHDHPCPPGQKCDTDRLKCANCKGNHASWTRACPVARAAFETQMQKEEYTTGKFEAYTPFTFADIEYTPGRRLNTHSLSPPPQPQPPLQINYIPATSPTGPHA
jgi:hypothetical protein